MKAWHNNKEKRPLRKKNKQITGQRKKHFCTGSHSTSRT